MSYSGELIITFASDWHCGTGAGKHGGIDREISLDMDGLPHVPARTLKGLWRDACERVAHALDNGGDSEEWRLLVRRLFGHPALAVEAGNSGGVVRVSPARLTSSWRDRVLGEDAEVMVPGLRVVRPGVAIDPTTGSARPDHLRLIEFARAGLELKASFTVEAPAHWAIDLLLGAGLRELTHIGSHRRRGAGRCSVSPTGLEDLEKVVGAHRGDVAAIVASSTLVRSGAPQAFASPDPLPADEVVHAATVLVTLDQPVHVTRTVLGNLMMTHDFIPAASLMPLVVDTVGRRQASSLLRAQRIVVTDAVPAIGLRRSARTPLCLTSGAKGTGWLDDPEDLHDARLGVRDSHDRAIGGWAISDADGWSVHRQDLLTIAHPSIDDREQRTLENGLFTIQAIPAGETLAFDVWLPESMVECFRQNVPKATALGRYRFGDYGAVNIEVHEPPEPETGPGEFLGGTPFSLWLTSDAYLINSLGHADPTPDALGRALESALRREHVETTIEVDGNMTFVTTVRRDSWTARDSLPRPTLTALGAGSVVTLVSSAPVPGASLQRTLALGLGMRRAEGFGRCRVLKPARTERATELRSDPRWIEQVEEAPKSVEPVAWPDVRRAVWRQEIQRRIRELATDTKAREPLLAKGVTASQLGSLRSAAADLASDAAAVDRWLDGVTAHDERAKLWADHKHVLRPLFGSGALAEPVHLASWLNETSAAIGFPQIPEDLGGNRVTEVASWLLVELLQQQTRKLQRVRQEGTGDE